MLKKTVAIILSALFCMSILAACGSKKEETQVTTTQPEEVTVAEKEDVTMQVAKDDVLRDFLEFFDTYTDGGDPGSMEYDHRDSISVRRLMDCLFGQRCCVNYETYPVTQPTYAENAMSVPGDSFSWVAKNIFHVSATDVEEYTNSNPAYSNGSFSGAITLNENGVWWYQSDVTIQKAEFDGTYYYIKYRRNHDDPAPNAPKYQGEYYGIFEKEEINSEEYWTLYTHSSSGFNLIVEDKNLVPDEVYEPEIEMVINTETPVTMRSGPSESYDKLASYSPGIPMMVIGKKGDWYYLHYYEHYGWIYSEFLTPTS